MAFNPKESLFAQIRNDDLNPRAGTQHAVVAAATIDGVIRDIGKKPHLLKIDVEGFEPLVLRGAGALLATEEPPALLFEWNPLTLREVGHSPEQLAALLRRFRIHYIDDFEGGRKALGEEIPDPVALTWACNLFAYIPGGKSEEIWERLGETDRRLRSPEKGG